MKAGAAQVDITPSASLELCGYAARTQPSTGVLDPLFCRALYLESDGARFLWLTLDLIAIPAEIVDDFRSFAGQHFGLRADQVMVSATHTHSAPATIQLNAAGQRDEAYMARLPGLLQQAARQALSRPEPCNLVTARSQLTLAIDRRHTRVSKSNHTDSQVLALGFGRPDGTFLATLLNYAMHPVALGHVNRAVSGDWPAYAAEELSTLPGRPISLITNGAAGNLNPPGEGWSRDQVRDLGRSVARSVKDTLAAGRPANAALQSASTRVPVPLEVLSPAQIDAAATAEISKIGKDHPWFKPIRDAIEAWKTADKRATVDIELHGLHLGGVALIGVNCEMFAQFITGLRAKLGPAVYCVGYTNGAFGYIAHSDAYDEGGYEVDSAHFFYNSFRPKRGSLEHLCERAADLLQSLAE